MRARQGVQAELLLSLALIMFTATALVLVTFVGIHRAQMGDLHSLLARGFAAEIARADFETSGFGAGSWWRLDPAGRLMASNGEGRPIDPETRSLGERALEAGSPHVQSGAPWSPIRFAAPSTDRRHVLAGRIEAAVSPWALAGMLLVDIAVFGVCGVVLLRRRVVGPLGRLAGAVQLLHDGDDSAPVPVEGVGEIAELAAAFNEMQTALASRTGALEKAVAELRTANQSLTQAREGLDRSERLAMVGSLAAGVAHEVGNPMGALVSYLDVAAREQGMSETAQRCLAKATEQGERVRVTLRQLLDFSRAPQPEHGPFALDEVAEQVAELVRAQREFESILIEVHRTDPDADLVCWGDRTFASQVLLNLVLNAAFETREQPGARIHLVLQRTYAQARDGDPESGPGFDRADGPDCIECAVEDSGNGIDPDQADRIFDPFFTTRPPGEGTGLGLANARKLASEMGGTVQLAGRSVDLGGARFVLRLPHRDQTARGPNEAGSQSRMS